MSTTTTEEANRRLVQREIDEAWNGDDLDVIDELYAENVTVGTIRTGSDDPVVSAADIKAVHADWDTAFPDAEVEINELVAEDDAVMVWWTIRGTHEGPFRGIDPTGNEIEVDGFSFRRIENGTITEVKDASSMTTLLTQLGRELPI